MGYQTDLIGQFEFSRELTVKEKQTIDDFAEERHESMEYPGIWCQWVTNDDGTALEWDGNEKFYNYVEWLEYLIKEYFEPWGVKLNGRVNWYGEESTDMGLIKVVDNKVQAIEAEINFPGGDDE